MHYNHSLNFVLGFVLLLAFVVKPDTIIADSPSPSAPASASAGASGAQLVTEIDSFARWQEVKNSTNPLFLLVYAGFDDVSLSQIPVVERLATKHSARVRFARIDGYKYDKVSAVFRVTDFPTMLMMAADGRVYRSVGRFEDEEKNEQELDGWIKGVLVELSTPRPQLTPQIGFHLDAVPPRTRK